MSDERNPSHNPYWNIVGFDIACVVISVVFVALRLYVRRVLVRKIGLDDWLLLIAVVLFVASSCMDAASWLILEYQGFDVGAGFSYQISTIGQSPYLLAEIFVRAAYAVFYLRVVPKELDLKWHRWIILGSFWTYSIYQFANVFINLFQCGSPANLTNPDAVCISMHTRGILIDVTYVLDAAVDWIMACVPIYVVYKSTMNRRTKASVYCILVLGCFAGVLAIATIPVSKSDGVNAGATDLQAAIKADITATAETLVAIMCLCLAALKPLFRKYLEGISDRHHSGPVSTDAMLPAFSEEQCKGMVGQEHEVA